MTKAFVGKLRDAGTGSLEVTIPNELVTLLDLHPGDLCELTIEKDIDANKALQR